MKKNFIHIVQICILLQCSIILHAQPANTITPPSWLWAKQAVVPITGWTKMSISADAEGNTFVTGSFSGTFTLPTSPTPTQLTSSGDADIFIAKYDASGNVLWARQAGGSKADNGNAIEYDGHGNVYIAGAYTESAAFGSTTLSNPMANSVNVFVAKYDAATGDLLWAEQGLSNSTSYSAAFDVAVDQDGDAYLTGQFVGTLTFDPLPTLNASGWWDIFVIKFSSTGAPQWQTKAGSPEAGYNLESGNGIVVDQSGNVFVTGMMNGSPANPTLFGNIPLISAGGGGFYEASYFLAKYNPSASVWEWAASGGGNKIDYGNKVSLDANGKIYVNGYFEEIATFGTNSITGSGPQSYFVAKYTSDGTIAWIHPTGGTGYYDGNGSKADAHGNLYFAGTFDGTTTVGDVTITSSGWDNAYIAKWNTNGVFQWVKHIPGSYYAPVFAMDVEPDGNVNILGTLGGNETFDCVTLDGSSGSMIIAKLGTSTLGPDAPTITASSNSVCSGAETILNIATGNLNNATHWAWYTGSCEGTPVGVGSSIAVNPIVNTTYYVRGEGGCAGPGDCASFTININNSAPVISLVSGPIGPVSINTPISVTATYPDVDVSTANIFWGDGSSEDITLSLTNSFTSSHAYSSPGVYTVGVAVTDVCGQASQEYKYQYIVIYDPSGGFVTGGGWINSPAGAYQPNKSFSGKAIFGFESKYLKGAVVPSGNTEFKFHAGDLNFKSADYEWLVVAGSRAQFKGSGTINGNGSYGFLLTAVDGQAGSGSPDDLFRIKIWDKLTGAIIYDNQYGSDDDASLNTVDTKLGGGSIIIHAPKMQNNNTVATGAGEENVTNYSRDWTLTALTNPTRSRFTIRSQSGSHIPLQVRVFDGSGKIREVQTNIAANSTISFGNRFVSGVYFVEVVQGTERRMIKLIKQ